MKLIAVEDTTLTLPDVAQMAKEGPIILTRNWKPLASVKDVFGSDWESVSLANNPRFVAIIEESRRSYREHGGIPLADLREELGLRKKPRGQAKRRRRKRG